MSPLRTAGLFAATILAAGAPALARDAAHPAPDAQAAPGTHTMQGMHGMHGAQGNQGMHPMHGGQGMPADPAARAAHIDMMVARLMPDASAEQKGKVAAIAKTAATDLLPLRTQLAANHARALQMLAQPTLDPVALESLRVAQVRLMDQASRRVLQAVLDASAQLTPAQRATFARHLHGLIGMSGMGATDGMGGMNGMHGMNGMNGMHGH
jgi:hypothetical protein